MRIITGKFKGANLYTVPGNTTRPTTDYLRELIFSIYQDFSGLSVLDLYAGTGSLGLEAFSRGAQQVDFVEFSVKALSALFKNIEKLKCADSCRVHRRKADAFLKTASRQWDVVFLDPPYNKDLVNPTLALIFGRNLVAADGLVIAEHSPAEKISADFSSLIIKHKGNKATAVTILATPAV